MSIYSQDYVEERDGKFFGFVSIGPFENVKMASDAASVIHDAFEEACAARGIKPKETISGKDLT